MNSKHKLFAQYPSLVSVLSILKSSQYGSLPEVEELLSIYSKTKEVKTDELNFDQSSRFPFIVLEGLDGCGKSHTSRLVAQKLNASLKSTPPNIISHIREKFDNHDSLLRRAYYSLGNYIAEKDVENTINKQPIVMDRFWHSTAAYAMANELIKNSDLKLPDKDDNIYEWPKDLIKPDLIIFLTTSEEIRLKRINNRKTITLEENELKKNEMFRNVLNRIYRNMRNPELFVVDNSDMSVEESADCIVEIIKKLPVHSVLEE